MEADSDLLGFFVKQTNGTELFACDDCVIAEDDDFRPVRRGDELPLFTMCMVCGRIYRDEKDQE